LRGAAKEGNGRRGQEKKKGHRQPAPVHNNEKGPVDLSGNSEERKKRTSCGGSYFTQKSEGGTEEKGRKACDWAAREGSATPRNAMAMFSEEKISQGGRRGRRRAANR